MIIHRNLGLAYLEENKLREAAGEFQKLVDIMPNEPLGHANLGLAYLRMRQLEPAEKWLQEALHLEPDHPDIGLMLAKVYESTEREKEAIHILESSLKKNPTHLRTLYQLAQYYLNTPDPGKRQKAERLLRVEDYLAQVVHALPANVAVRLELVELLLRNEKPAQAVEQMEMIRQILPELPEGSQEMFQKSLELMRDANAEQALTPTRMFHNVLKSSSFYQAANIELKGTSSAISGEPIPRFSHELSLHIHERTGIPEALSFTEVTIASGLNIVSSGEATAPGDDNPKIVMAYGDYDSDGDQDIFVSQWLAEEQASRHYLFANNQGLFAEVAAKVGISHKGRDLFALFADYDNDGYLDLFVTNTKADRLYHNTREGRFREVTSSAGIQTANSRAALFVDLDLEGDLDLFIAGNSQNWFYRNNSDGTFTEIAEEAGITGKEMASRDAAFGDFDDDGDIDLFVANQNAGNQYFDNLRQGYFRNITGHTGLATAGGSGATAVGDYNNDGYLDLFVTDLTGEQHSLFRNRGDGTFEREARSDSAFASLKGIAGFDAAFFDADNDGFLDLLAAGSAGILPAVGTTARGDGLWLFYNNGEGKYSDASSLLPELPSAASQVEIFDYDHDGDLDIFLVGFNSLHVLRNDGGNLNNYIVVRLAALRTGSGKNNYFGIGAKVEVKAGALNQTRVMSDPIAHFGLGNQERADLVRVVWSNGVAQNWFNPEKNQTIMEDQTLKGSCPWLYAWNGKEYEFFTDVLWTSALGMPLGIMGKEMSYAFPHSSKEYFKIHGEKLQVKNGRYSLQFTSELWEASYVDQIKLLAVDHPDSVDIFVDEKFTPPPFPAFRIYAVADKRLPVSARDGQGNGVLQKIADEDGEYVSLTPAKYQGVTEPHDLILDLGDLSQGDNVFLFLKGWLFPTDASINVNMAQSNAVNSMPPFLQVIDEERNWKTVTKNLGFPKGKNKTVIVDLSNKFLGADRRVRIRTNMQIYWDYIFYTTTATKSSLPRVNLEPVAADLHYRGFSEVTRETPYSPHMPDYQTVTTAPKWRDLTGHYTRYGEVLPLLTASDSRYVIMNAGDELTLEFDAALLPALPSGWKRDFLFYNDGWVKDGDLNTAHGQTVEPFPFQSMSSYPYSQDESYPNDEEHANFLQTYNTRKITAETFKRVLFDMKTKDKKTN